MNTAQKIGKGTCRQEVRHTTSEHPHLQILGDIQALGAFSTAAMRFV